MKREKVLYFVDGVLPPENLIEKALNSPKNICFRNAQFHSDEHSLEECDSVGGCFPDAYKELKNFKLFEFEKNKPDVKT
jgi:hypothetical protein